jgi:hypothetical protein
MDSEHRQRKCLGAGADEEIGGGGGGDGLLALLLTQLITFLNNKVGKALCLACLLNN